jgi:hypothetical protein
MLKSVEDIMSDRPEKVWVVLFIKRKNNPYTIPIEIPVKKEYIID